MATVKQIAANRRNALKSTGPRSVEGKKRSSSNAYRHGLSLGLIVSPDVQREILALATALRQGLNDSVSVDEAVGLAQGQLELQNIRGVKNATISTAYVASLSKRDKSRTPAAKPEEALAKCIVDLLPRLRKLGRYERRAVAACNRAWRRIVGE
jgi:hypothetical protein